MSGPADQALFITGATGFIGSYVMNEAVKRNQKVIALVRQNTQELQNKYPAVEFLVGDLTRVPLELSDKNIGTVIHLAASMSGTAEEQFNATVTGTDNLLNAMRYAKIKRCIGVSSIAVLDYFNIAAHSMIDEAAPLSDETALMGVYAQAKLAQEKLFQQFGSEDEQECIILRPGLVYDENQLMSAHAGIIKGPVRLLASHSGQVPVIHAVSLADAIMNTFTAGVSNRTVLHLVDDNLPSQKTYLSALKQRRLLSGGIQLPWKLLSIFSSTVSGIFQLIGLQGKLPEILLPHSFSARLRPYQFSNEKARTLLHWKPNSYFT